MKTHHDDSLSLLIHARIRCIFITQNLLLWGNKSSVPGTKTVIQAKKNLKNFSVIFTHLLFFHVFFFKAQLQRSLCNFCDNWPCRPLLQDRNTPRSFCTHLKPLQTSVVVSTVDTKFGSQFCSDDPTHSDLIIPPISIWKDIWHNSLIHWKKESTWKLILSPFLQRMRKSYVCCQLSTPTSTETMNNYHFPLKSLLPKSQPKLNKKEQTLQSRKQRAKYGQKPCQESADSNCRHVSIYFFKAKHWKATVKFYWNMKAANFQRSSNEWDNFSLLCRALQIERVSIYCTESFLWGCGKL